MVEVMGVLALSQLVYGKGSLAWLDGEQALPLEVQKVLLLKLLNLQKLLLEGQLLSGYLLLIKHKNITLLQGCVVTFKKYIFYPLSPH